MANGGIVLPVIGGLGIGVGFIVILAAIFVSSPSEDISRRHESIVIIPEGSFSPLSEHNNFEPAIIKVVIGVNNTVRWVNHDSFVSSVYADSEDDPLFYNATRLQCVNNDYDNCVLIPGKNTLLPGGIFEFTFTKPGEFSYHSVPQPHKHGTVIVLPHP